jgi:hypothetical protein
VADAENGICERELIGVWDVKAKLSLEEIDGSLGVIAFNECFEDVEFDGTGWERLPVNGVRVVG